MVYQAMTVFFDLFLRNASHPQPEVDPAWLDRTFLELLADSPFRLWRPGDPILSQGERLLIGVAPWSGYDLRLLDVIAESLSNRRSPVVSVVEVFNVADCKSQRDFKEYIPGLRAVTHSPVVSVWRDGRLIEAREGYEARDLAARRFGSSSAEIVQYVQDRIKTPSPAP